MVPTSPSGAQRRYLVSQCPSSYSGVCADRQVAGLRSKNDQLLREIERLRDLYPAEDVRLLSQLLQVQENERQLVAHEIHDGIAQLLIGALMQLDVLGGNCPAFRSSDAAAFSQLERWLRQALDKARSVIDDLHPPKSPDAGLEAAMGSLATSYLVLRRPIQIEFESNLDGRRFDSLFEDAVIRLVRKGLADAVKYGDVDRMKLAAGIENGQLELELSGWTRGFEPRLRGQARFDLASIRERVRFLQGEFAIRASSDSALSFMICLPVPRW